MAEYIKRDAALKALLQVSAPTPSESYIVEKCVEKINRLPMMELVRCKDCKGWCPEEIAKRYGADRYCTMTMMLTDADDFCSYGERKDNERKAD